ncbi:MULTISPECIES: Uma2 family endonuclease [unclassified Microcoleus]|uniref:Uma2 family endonuclease n=1 Tax=unclassified Microcoleus TaxID=2642155 RepID=UPI002FD15175
MLESDGVRRPSTWNSRLHKLAPTRERVEEDRAVKISNTADILLVIEVSDSTLKYDRETKLFLYAEAGISNYWIFNLVDNQLEMYSEPDQKRQGDFNYRSQRVGLPDEAVAIPGFPDLSLVFPA